MTNEQELKVIALKEANVACSTARYQSLGMGVAPMHPNDMLTAAKGIYAWLTEDDSRAQHPAPAAAPKIRVTNHSRK